MVNFITSNPVEAGWDRQQARQAQAAATALQQVQTADAIDQSQRRRDEARAMDTALGSGTPGTDHLETMRGLSQAPGLQPATRLRLMQEIAQIEQQRAAAARAEQAQRSREQYQDARLRQGDRRMDSRPPVAVMGDDGQPVLVSPDQAVGRRPAPHADTGRPIAVVDPATGQPTLVAPRDAIGRQPVSRDIEVTTTPGANGAAPTTTVRMGQGGRRGQSSDPTQPTQTEQTRLQQNIGDNTARLQRIEDIARAFRPEYQQLPTQGANWARGMYERMGGTLAPESQRQLQEYTSFRSRAFNDLTQTLRQMSGAAVTPSEAERLLQVIGDPSSDSPTQFQTKLNETLRAVRLANARLHYYMRNGFRGALDEVPLSDMEGIIDRRGNQIAAELRQQGIAEDQIEQQVRAGLANEFGFTRQPAPAQPGQRSDAGGNPQLAQAPVARAEFAAGRAAPEPPNSMGDMQPLYAPGAPMPDAPRSMWQMDPRSNEPHPMIPQGAQPNPGAPTTPNLYRPNGARSPAFDPTAPASDFGDGMGAGDRAQMPEPYRTRGLIRDDYGNDVAPGQRQSDGGFTPNGYRPQTEYTYPGASPARAPAAPGPGAAPAPAAPGPGAAPAPASPSSQPAIAPPRGNVPFSDRYADTLIAQEGTGRNPRSSAAGVGQFLEGTWLGRPDAPGILARLAVGNPGTQALLQRAWAGDQDARARLLALRNDPTVARAAIAEYARQTAGVFRNAGIEVNDTNLALSHFLGPSGATRFIRAAQADPNVPVNRIMPAAVLRANPEVLMPGGQPITAGALYAQYARRYDGGASVQGGQPMPPASDPSMGSNPDQNPGIAPLAAPPGQAPAPAPSATAAPELWRPGAITPPAHDPAGAMVQRDLGNLARQAPDLMAPTSTPPTPQAAPMEPAPAAPAPASPQQSQREAHDRLVADLRRVVNGEPVPDEAGGPAASEATDGAGADTGPVSDASPGYAPGDQLAQAALPQQAAPPQQRWSDRLLSGQDAPQQELRASTRGAPDRGPIVGDDASRGAGILTQMRAGLAPDVNDQIRRFAAARFPGVPIDQAVRRYGVIDGNIVYADDQGRIWRETPSVVGGRGVGDTAGRVMAWLASGVGPQLPQIAGMAAGAMVAPFSPAAAVPAAGAAAGGVDVVRQAIDRALAGESPGNIDLGNAALHGGQAMLGQGATGVINRVATRNPLRVGGADLTMLRDPANLAQFQANEALAQRYGITVTPGENTGARSLLARQRQLGRFDESANTMGDFYRTRNDQQLPGGFETFSREITGTPAGQPVPAAADAARRFQTGADEAMQRAITARTQQATPLYQRAYANGIQWTDELANLMTRPAMRDAWARAQQIAANEGHTLPQVINVAQDGTITVNRVPDMRAIDYIKRGLDDVVQGARNQTTGRIETDAGRGVNRLRDEFLGIVDRLNPDYAAARAQFATDSPAVTAITEGPVGRAAQERQDRFRQAPIQVFDRNSADPTTIRVARQAFERAGRIEDWNAGLHAFLQDRFAQAMRAANTAHDFQRAVWADPRQRAILQAAMTPEQQTAFRDFLRVMDMVQRAPAEGSPTATDLGARAAFAGPGARTVATGTAAIGPWRIPDRVRDFAMDMSAGRNAARIADIITQPGAVARLQQLRMIPPNGVRALSIVDGLLADLGVAGTGATTPNDQPVPAVQGRQ